jgi:hypothetical protein
MGVNASCEFITVFAEKQKPQNIGRITLPLVVLILPPLVQLAGGLDHPKYPHPRQRKKEHRNFSSIALEEMTKKLETTSSSSPCSVPAVARILYVEDTH